MIFSTQSAFWFSWGLSLFSVQEMRAVIFCFIFCLKALQYFFWSLLPLTPNLFSINIFAFALQIPHDGKSPRSLRCG